MQNLEQKIDALTAQVQAMAERQRARDELLDELVPITKEIMKTASGKLEDLEERGYFAFGKELLSVADAVVSHYTPEDVQELSQAIVTILDAVRAMTQPHVMEVAQKAGDAVEAADTTEPVGMMGMVKASRDEEVQRGMGVMLEVLRKVGEGAKKADRRERLRKQLASRHGRTTRQLPPPRESRGVRAARNVPVARAAAAPAATSAPTQAMPDLPGVAFTSEGFLQDPNTWTKEIAVAIAKTLNVNELTDQHWKLIEFARKEYADTGASPNIRRLTQGSGIPTKDVYTMFPKAPGKACAKIAGLPKPVGCI